MKNRLIEELECRGLVAQLSDESLREQLERGPMCMYVGFDPTADSLHLGHLLPVMIMSHFQKAGHRIICLVGGATGMVGDPSGRSDERNLLTPDQVKLNAAAIKEQLSRFLDFEGSNPARMVDNNDWIAGMSFIDWLRDVGKHFKLNSMLAKESVKKRMEASEGISYTEFSYQTMQAYDFYHLFENEGCSLQGGGNDQWGNITAGIDLIQKKNGKQAYGITFPLVATASGEKFGKTAGNAVWLDAAKLSPYEFYQYWIKADDRDVGKFLKYFTFIDVEEIEQICMEHEKCPEKRLAQTTLAEYMTGLVHGPERLKKAQQATMALFGGELDELSDQDLEEIFRDVPSHEAPLALIEQHASITDCLVAAKAFASKGAIRRLIEGGGLYVSNKRLDCSEMPASDLLPEDSRMLVIRQGKKKYSLVHFVG